MNSSTESTFFTLEVQKNLKNNSVVATITSQPEMAGLLMGSQASEVARQMVEVQAQALAQAPEHAAVHLVLNLSHLGVINPIGNAEVLSHLTKLVEIAKDYRVQVYICCVKDKAEGQSTSIFSMNPIKWTIVSKLIQKLGYRSKLDISNLGFVTKARFATLQKELLNS
jgi:hypothetical protein